VQGALAFRRGIVYVHTREIVAYRTVVALRVKRPVSERAVHQEGRDGSERPVEKCSSRTSIRQDRASGPGQAPFPEDHSSFPSSLL